MDGLEPEMPYRVGANPLKVVLRMLSPALEHPWEIAYRKVEGRMGDFY